MNKKWHLNDIEYLIKNYEKINRQSLVEKLERSWGSIQIRARRLGLKRFDYSQKWSEFEISYLLKNYGTSNKTKMVSELVGRNWAAIQHKANSLNLKRDMKNFDITKLSNETSEAYYWLGFIFADGHFNSNNQLEINISKKDLNHLKKFANYIEYNKNLIKPRISVSYSKIKNWLSVFDVKHNKTYEPCNISHLTGDKLFSLIIGFIDGDGSISEKGALQIKCHKSWLENMNFMIRHLSGDNKYCGIVNKEGLALVILTKIEIMKKTRKRAEMLNLPFLKRKWTRVRFEKLSKLEKHNHLKSKCFELFDKGFIPKIITKDTGISLSFVYNARKDYIAIKEREAKQEMKR